MDSTGDGYLLDACRGTHLGRVTTVRNQLAENSNQVSVTAMSEDEFLAAWGSDDLPTFADEALVTVA